MSRDDARCTKASLDVRQLSLNVVAGPHWWRCIHIFEQERPLLPDEGKAKVKSRIQNEVERTVPQSEPNQNLV